MPSPYITDLIDHKERVSAYMRAVADAFLMREISRNTPYVRRLDEKSTLIDLTELVVNLGGTSNEPSLTGQLGTVFRNTLAYFTKATIRHSWLGYAVSDLFHRASVHDHSKFSPEEFEAYEQTFPDLQKYAYGSPEFRDALFLIKPALMHHYQVNDHHPEHFDNGIPDMHNAQLLEMCSDWKAASERSQKDIRQGLLINKERFKIDDHLYPIIENTVIWLEDTV